MGVNISKGFENLSQGLQLMGRRVGEREDQEWQVAREENFLRMRQKHDTDMEGLRTENDMKRDEKNFEQQKGLEADRRLYETGENDKQFGRQRQLEGERATRDDARYDKDELRRLRGEQASRMGEVDSLLSDLNKEAQETLRSIAESGNIDLSSAEGVKQAWNSPLMAPYASQRERLEKAKDGIRKEYAVRLGDAGDPYAASVGSDAPPKPSGSRGRPDAARASAPAGQVAPVAGKPTTTQTPAAAAAPSGPAPSFGGGAARRPEDRIRQIDEEIAAIGARRRQGGQSTSSRNSAQSQRGRDADAEKLGRLIAEKQRLMRGGSTSVAGPVSTPRGRPGSQGDPQLVSR